MTAEEKEERAGWDADALARLLLDIYLERK
jgi:hypothetical protein